MVTMVMVMVMMMILNDLALGYLSDLISAYKSIRTSLRSAHKNLLVAPRTKLKTFVDRCFLAASPVLWYAIPPSIRNNTSVPVYKKGANLSFQKEYWYLILFDFYIMFC